MFKAFYDDPDTEISNTPASDHHHVPGEIIDLSNLEEYAHSQGYEHEMAARNLEYMILNILFNPEYTDATNPEGRQNLTNYFINHFGQLDDY